VYEKKKNFQNNTTSSGRTRHRCDYDEVYDTYRVYYHGYLTIFSYKITFKYAKSPRYTLYPNVNTLQSIYNIDRCLGLICLSNIVYCRYVSSSAICIYTYTTAASLLRTDRLYRKKNVQNNVLYICIYVVYGIFFLH
jgi:hypothetical protein